MVALGLAILLTNIPSALYQVSLHGDGTELPFRNPQNNILGPCFQDISKHTVLQLLEFLNASSKMFHHFLHFTWQFLTDVLRFRIRLGLWNWRYCIHDASVGEYFFNQLHNTCSLESFEMQLQCILCKTLTPPILMLLTNSQMRKELKFLNHLNQSIRTTINSVRRSR